MAIINGTNGDDNLLGVYGVDKIFGFGGRDYIQGALTASGGDDDDYIHIVTDTAHGDAGNDTIDGAVYAYGDDGDDTIISATFAYGGLGNDFIRAIEQAYGEDGDDDIRAENFGGATAFGGNGNDIVSVGGDGSIAHGDAGNDTVTGSVAYGDDGNDRVSGETARGGNGDDIVTGAGVFGDAGNDQVTGDDAFGGDGNDIVHATFIAHGDAGDDTVTSTDDTAYGDDGNDIVQGLTAFGGNGNDDVSGDTAYGDAGDDIVRGTAESRGGTGNDTIHVGQGIAYGEDGNDKFLLVDINPHIDWGPQFTYNAFTGEGFYVYGYDQYEPTILDGGNNFDVLQYGNGNDAFMSDVLADVVAQGMVNIERVNLGAGDDVMNYTTKLIALTVYGEDGDDTIWANKSSDYLDGGNGNDIIRGGSGKDSIYGSNGKDSLYGDGSDDNVSGGNDDDIVRGGSGNDFVSGGNGIDTLYGDSGNDRLNSGVGADLLYGGADSDTFVFDALSLGTVFGRDIVRDFSLAQGDKLELNNLLQGYDPLTSLITDFVKITESLGNSYVSVDTNGAVSGHIWTQIARLDGVTGITDEAALLTGGTLVVV